MNVLRYNTLFWFLLVCNFLNKASENRKLTLYLWGFYFSIQISMFRIRLWNDNKWFYCLLQYYQAKGLSEDEIRLQVRDCSRHRAKYKAPSTPEHFWSVDFPDTMECEKRGKHYFLNNSVFNFFPFEHLMFSWGEGPTF